MQILRAIGDGTRFLLLKKIAKGEICACKLPKFAKISQPAVSQHLKILLRAGLVDVRTDGTKRLYSVSQKGGKVLFDIGGW